MSVDQRGKVLSVRGGFCLSRCVIDVVMIDEASCVYPILNTTLR
jgi:hypothetical protein